MTRDIIRFFKLHNPNNFRDFICDFEILALKYPIFLGLTGSAIGLQQYKDIDLILILPDNLFLSEEFNLPSSLHQGNWESAKKLLEKIDVVGSYYLINPAIRVEIYPFSTAIKILDKHVITIKRAKDVPKKNKNEMFISRNGESIYRLLVFRESLSETVSLLNFNNQLYWGMHYERLILAEKILETLDFSSALFRAKKDFSLNSKGEDISNLFYCSINNPVIDIQKTFPNVIG
jgi:hypothetical protein